MVRVKLYKVGTKLRYKSLINTFKTSIIPYIKILYILLVACARNIKRDFSPGQYLCCAAKIKFKTSFIIALDILFINEDLIHPLYNPKIKLQKPAPV